MLKQCGIILLLLASTYSFNLSAKIYTWTDKEGKVHFSDKPVADEKVTIITPKKNKNIANPVTTGSQWQQDYNKAKAAKAKKAQKESQLLQKNRGYCQQLKRELATINRGGRIYVLSLSGERTFKNEAQLKKDKKEITKAYKKTCR
ncbi:DUF4124 domain-containing protein [Colwellia piezophila]|uniref:DUF4124 domain-containing protein n=1 Tax=Colwellia piezophila TaxID=211668 RepID=UPI0003826C0D|nr:DUF4124 domain-containing protein [Colwellia piezophila]